MAQRLAAETSPYLLLHKDDPVEWWPWGRAALDEAAKTGKPIFLSTGYLACHWCHAMQRESFADPETAAQLNASFICIIIDKEERPDLDAVFQASVQAMGQPGGWPLSVFLTPEGDPFAGGSYFPKTEQPELARPAFGKVLSDVRMSYDTKQSQVEGNVSAVKTAIKNVWEQAQPNDMQLSPVALEGAARRTCQMMDVFSGGLNGQPKFPNYPVIEKMWRAFQRTGARQFVNSVETQLANMCLGGLYDHLGGGFARYANDEYWILPHFEKMLNDNALMIDVLAMVWPDTRNPTFKARIEETVAWMQRELLTPEGAFATSVGADSEGRDGAYYVWTPAEIESVLGVEDTKLFRAAYDVRDEGNWGGRSVLHRLRQVPLEPMAEGRINSMRLKLLEARGKRPRPMTDDKILADWNGLAIRALANAAFVLNRIEWQAMAVRAFWFVADTMGDGAKLAHSYRAGRKTADGFAEDYAFMARAALTLFEMTGDQRYLQKAQAWIGELDGQFWSQQFGGYTQTSNASEVIIARPRSGMDAAVPNVNGIVAETMVHLYFLTGEQHYRDRGNLIMATFARDALTNAPMHATLFNALDTILRTVQIVIIGERQAADVAAMRDVLRRVSMPTRILHIVANSNMLPSTHPAYGRPATPGRATLYLCAGGQVSAPVVDPNQFEAILRGRTGAAPQQR